MRSAVYNSQSFSASLPHRNHKFSLVEQSCPSSTLAEQFIMLVVSSSQLRCWRDMTALQVRICGCGVVRKLRKTGSCTLQISLGGTTAQVKWKLAVRDWLLFVSTIRVTQPMVHNLAQFVMTLLTTTLQISAVSI